MKKYVIVKAYTDEGRTIFRSYRYSRQFRLFGIGGRFGVWPSLDVLTFSFGSAEDCKEKLKIYLESKDKYEIIEVIEL